MSSAQRSVQSSTGQVGKIKDQLLSNLLRLPTWKTSPDYTEKTVSSSAYVYSCMKSQVPQGSWVEGVSSSRNDSALASTGHMIPSFSVLATDMADLPSVTCKCPSS